MIKSAPENKDGRAAARSEEKPPEPGPDGVVHIMQEEMQAEMEAAEGVPDYGIEEKAEPFVIHFEELRLKGEAIADAVAAYDGPKVDTGLPEPEEPPLGGKPPEPPLGGEGRSSDGKPKPTQMPADKRGRR